MSTRFISGIIFLTNLEIGYSTPPVGINLFIASARFDQSVLKLYRASLPFLAILLAALFVITYVPELSLLFVRHGLKAADSRLPGNGGSL